MNLFRLLKSNSTIHRPCTAYRVNRALCARVGQTEFHLGRAHSPALAFLESLRIVPKYFKLLSCASEKRTKQRKQREKRLGGGNSGTRATLALGFLCGIHLVQQKTTEALFLSYSPASRKIGVADLDAKDFLAGAFLIPTLTLNRPKPTTTLKQTRLRVNMICVIHPSPAPLPIL